MGVSHVFRECEGRGRETISRGLRRQTPIFRSSWPSPNFKPRSAPGSWRFCIDFRKLNEVTIKDAFPLPQVNDLVDTLSGHKYFITLNLASGYWQVPMEESSQEKKTAFVIPGGSIFHFKRLPFGLCNAVPKTDVKCFTRSTTKQMPCLFR